MELTELVRLRLRIKSKDFDEGEIKPLISAAQADLKRVLSSTSIGQRSLL